MSNGRPTGYLTLTLHAHLPYVVNHGTWPHGLEWLHEAAAETYLPLLRVLRKLERDGIAMKATVNLSPTLLEQLSHPVFIEEFPKYLERKIVAAHEDENYFRQMSEERFAKTARYWLEFFQLAMTDFQAMDGDILKGFRHFNDTGQIEIIACAATHAYFPLLGTDESLTAQVQTGVATHRRHLGKQPRGMWAPECGYRPGGMWQAPVIPVGESRLWAPFQRMGVEEAIAQADIEYFFIDTHLVDEGTVTGPYETTGPYQDAGSSEQEDPLQQRSDAALSASIYTPYFVEGGLAYKHPVSVFPRDPRTGLQVWSRDHGYPGDGVYLDFHKKRWPGGHRYWQVTHAKADLAFKTPYYPEEAAIRTRQHAEHYVSVVCETLERNSNPGRPPVLTSPFDAELFGHWWYEGPLWLEHVARIFARDEVPVKMITCGEYMDHYPATIFLALPEGSWGKNGTNEVWLNPETGWTWAHIYPAERTVRSIVTEGKWKDGGMGERIIKQLCRELLLMESSDWQFLITTEAAADYARARFMVHVEQFREVQQAWEEFLSSGQLQAETEARLAGIEVKDSIFKDIDPSLWTQVNLEVQEVQQGDATRGAE